ncbi:hypothetical protein JW933_05545 [candidate division FCPU426 bacterium]|nr:hypothetical protein [candidate division FCPU426 bacterium]
MKKHPSKKDVTIYIPESDPFDGRAEMRRKEELIQLQNTVAKEFEARISSQPPYLKKLFKGFLEIADFMLKNTTGVGSNFELAECDVARISREDIRRYYQLTLVLLTYHCGCLLPDYREKTWKQAVKLAGDMELCRQFKNELETCVDHESGGFSPVQAGHKLWEQAQALMHVQPSGKNSTARIYYQTAPGQNLIFVVEKGAAEGWFKKA